MENQKLVLSHDIPEKWKPKYIIKRIDEDDITISLEERNKILSFLEQGTRFIHVQDHILMLNSIKSIDPKWGKDNIPPRPRPQIETTLSEEKQMGIQRVVNQEELDEWDKFFGKTADISIYGK